MIMFRRSEARIQARDLRTPSKRFSYLLLPEFTDDCLSPFTTLTKNIFPTGRQNVKSWKWNTSVRELVFVEENNPGSAVNYGS